VSGRYAQGTDVSSDRSRSEIERTLARYGASAFAYAWQGDRASIQFEAHSRRVRFVLPLPDRDSREFRLTPTGRDRSATAQEQAYEQAVRQRWRALAAGITTFEEEFLPHTVLPSGRTVAEDVLPAIAHAYESGAVEPLQLTAGGAR
jgi:hypothetical protein